MSFTNDAVVLPEISIAKLPLQPISPKYRIINIAINVFFTCIALAVVLILKLELFFPAPEFIEHTSPLIVGVILGLGGLMAIYHFFADPIIQYAVREQDVHFQAGLFFRKLVSQPILRIQHIELKRGPIERKAGLATLQVFSAGGMSHTFEIPGLEYDKAVALRKFIIDHKDLSVDE
jgi:membrane protein YdbS with pleckstrin-like domain